MRFGLTVLFYLQATPMTSLAPVDLSAALKPTSWYVYPIIYNLFGLVS